MRAVRALAAARATLLPVSTTTTTTTNTIKSACHNSSLTTTTTMRTLSPSMLTALALALAASATLAAPLPSPTTESLILASTASSPHTSSGGPISDPGLSHTLAIVVIVFCVVVGLPPAVSPSFGLVD